MKFKVGDKVKFLNEPGGGIVCKIISTSMVNVSIEEGFDIPVLTSELIRIESDGHTSDMFREDFNVELSQELSETIDESGIRTSKLERAGKQGTQEEGIYLAYHPHDQRWLVTGMLDIYLINYTKTDILFSIFIKEAEGKKYEGIDYGSLQPYSKYLVETIDHDHIRRWNQGAVQVLFHNDQPSQLLPPVSSDFSIKSSRFANDSQYQESFLLPDKSLIVKITEKPIIQELKQEKPSTEAPQPIKQKAVQPKEEQLIDKYMTSRDEAVVDLHIGQVVDDLTDLSPHDMLQVQINHFTKCLENAMKNGLRKVTFIHGVGNGTLKDAIIEEMKAYEKLEHQSASLAKFGVGAVDIIIYYNQ